MFKSSFVPLRKVSTSNSKILAAFYFVWLWEILHSIPAFSEGQVCPAYPFSCCCEEFILGLFSPECNRLHTWSFTDKNPKFDCLLQQYSICHLNHLFIPFYEYFNAKNISTLLCYFHGNLKRGLKWMQWKTEVRRRRHLGFSLCVLSMGSGVTGPKLFSVITGYKIDYRISDLYLNTKLKIGKQYTTQNTAFSLLMDWIENQSTLP